MSSRTIKVLVIGEGDAGKTSLRARYLTDRFQPAYRATIGADFVSKTVEVSIPVPRESRRRRRLSQSSTSSCQPSCREEEQEAQNDQGSSSEPMRNDRDKAASPSRAVAGFSELAAAAAARRQEKMRVTLSIWDTAGQERFRSLGTAFYRGADAVIIAFDVTKKGALARTLNWYRDFCTMGDIGKEGQAGNTPKQARKAREQRERFCWVAVGCKGDLLEQLRGRRKDVDDGWSGVAWTEARQWFDDLSPRFLPPGQKETCSFYAKQDPDSSATVEAYTIDGQIPAKPEDVLSRPSPHNRTPTLTVNEGVGSIEARHPGAGPPPGESPIPGAQSKLRKQPSLRMHSKHKSVSSFEPWQDGVPISNTSNSPARSSYQRSRYDSTASQSGNSVYYSIRGSTMLSQSPAATNGSNTDALSSSARTATLHSGYHDGHRRDGSLGGRSSHDGTAVCGRKQSGLSEVDIDDDDDDEENEGRTTEGSALRPAPKTAESGSSSGAKTERGIPPPNNAKLDHDQGGTKERNSSSGSGEDTPVAVPTVPSGDPIPFPTEDNEEEAEHEGFRARRRKRLSRASMKRKSITRDTDERAKEEAHDTALVTQSAKEGRQEQEQEQKEDHRVFLRPTDLSQEEVNRRMTLYSARPSSCSSTIRPADAGVDGDETSNHVDQSAEQQGKAKQDDEATEDSDAESDLYEDQMEQGFRLFYTSAKTGASIDDVFNHIARRVAIRWAYEEWEEAQRRQAWGYGPEGEVRTAPPTNEELERERVRRAIKISQGKGTGGCCS